MEVEVQDPAVAVMVKIAVCWVLVLLVNVPVIAEPDPPAAMPVRFVVLVLVQAKVVPATLFGLVISI